MEFIETRPFTEAIQALGAEESLRVLQCFLVENPGAGDLIQGTGGFRKVRMALQGRGKRGSARVIYLYLRHAETVILAAVYSKGSQGTLSHKEKNHLRVMATEFKRWL